MALTKSEGLDDVEGTAGQATIGKASAQILAAIRRQVQANSLNRASLRGRAGKEQRCYRGGEDQVHDDREAVGQEADEPRAY
ncbi:MAG: hypothetical protein ACLP1D_00855 [Xanthobacteraceae bacterium]